MKSVASTAIPLIHDASAISGEWMRRVLTAGDVNDAAQVAQVEISKLSDVANALGNLYRCRLLDEHGNKVGPGTVIVKLPSADKMALRFGRWLSLGRREHVFYRDVAPHGLLRTPRLFYGDFDERSHRFVLVLEDLGGMHQFPQVPGVDEERALHALGELAQMQGRFWNAPDDPILAAGGPFLNPRQRRIMQAVYLLTLPAALDRFGDLFAVEMRQLAEDLGVRLAAQLSAYAAGPCTVVHGDFRADNLMFDSETPDKFAVIDWQGFGIGCGMYDIAFFLGTSVAADVRRRIERAAVGTYHDIVCRSGAQDYTSEDCWRSYRENMLVVLMPMVIGCGALEMGDREMVGQAREMLSRVLEAIGDLDGAEMLPRERLATSASGWAAAKLWRGTYRTFGLALGLHGRMKRG